LKWRSHPRAVFRCVGAQAEGRLRICAMPAAGTGLAFATAGRQALPNNLFREDCR
jgi:hypothetical protein